MVSSLFVLVLFGLFGGFVRALYGSFKSVGSGRPLNVWYFLFTLISSGVIGGVVGVLFVVDVRVACLSGYVGSDIIENVVVAVVPKSLVVRK